jgi:trigger factor
MAKQYGMEVDKLVEAIGPQNIETVSGDLKMRKAIDFVYENAVIK